MDFRRIIQHGKFIPEIDGLRFIAISSVVFYHIHGFLEVKNKNTYLQPYNTADTPSFIANGSLGVELFFVISGFILGLFFAKAYLNEEKVNHLSYFKRRLTRLEPPYIIIMFTLFLFIAFVLKNLSVSEAAKNLFYSLTYSSNFFLGRGVTPVLNAVVWSLEVEVQFYILAPLIGLVFKIKNTIQRRGIIILATIISALLGELKILPFVSIVDYIEYFLVGFFLVDLFLSNTNTQRNMNKYLASILGLSILYFYFQLKLPHLNTDYNIAALYTLGQLILLFLLFYLVLFQKSLEILKNKVITNIGGACYTIYLLHYPVISVVGNRLVKYQVSQYQLVDTLLYTVILSIFILLVSAIFFILIERPCMKSDWYKSIF